MNSPFAIFMARHPEVRLFGISVETSLQRASVDCPRLWKETFCPRMPELSGKPAHEYQGPSYGVSVITNHDKGEFTYWAGMEAPAEGTPPAGMAEFVLPGGLFACCRIPSLTMLGEAYSYMYKIWPTTKGGVPLNPALPCFEHYDSRFCQSNTLEVYVPVLETRP